MDRNIDFNTMGGFSPYENNYDMNGMGGDMFNPVLQYEQAYMYYRYLTMQTEYKIKCKEYEKLCGNTKERRVE